MSRRSLKVRKTLGRPARNTGNGNGQPRHQDHASGCGGDKVKFQMTRPHTKVVGTGKWLGPTSLVDPTIRKGGGGVGNTVTLPEK